MTDLWTTLLPLIVGSAILPIQITIILVMLRSDGGLRRASAWVAGMTLVRLAQGAVFGLLLGAAAAEHAGGEGPGTIASTLLLVVGVLFLVAAAKKALDQPDEDAPPPRWMGLVESMPPARALAVGAGVIALSPKLWVFTLAAIGVIEEAGLDLPAAIASYLVFVVAAVSIQLAAISIAAIAPGRAGVVLDRLTGLLERNGRLLTIVLGIVFGAWFVLKALDGLGVL